MGEPRSVAASLLTGKSDWLRSGVVLASCVSYYRGAALWSAAGADRDFLPHLCHRDVDERFNHRGTVVRAVLDSTVTGAVALLAIASGYLFTALILIPWILTFPGVFAPLSLLGTGNGSASGEKRAGLANGDDKGKSTSG